MRAQTRDSAAVVVSVAFFAFAACGSPAASTQREAMAHVLAQRMAPVTTLASAPSHTPAVRPALTAQQLVTALRDGGMPISAIAEAARVERKSVYAWLQGSRARGDSLRRLEAIHSLMTSNDADVRNLYRFWHSKVDGERTLRDLMVSDQVGSREVREIVRGLGPAVRKAMETARKMARSGTENPVLDDIPEAVGLR